MKKIMSYGLMLCLLFLTGCGDAKLLKEVDKVAVVGIKFNRNVPLVTKKEFNSDNNRDSVDLFKLGSKALKKDSKLRKAMENIGLSEKKFFDKFSDDLITKINTTPLNVVGISEFYKNENYKSMKQPFAADLRYYIPEPYIFPFIESKGIKAKEGHDGVENAIFLCETIGVDAVATIDVEFVKIETSNSSEEVKDIGIKHTKPSDPEEDKTLPSYLEKNCTKPIELVLKKFDLSKEERDLELEKIKVETQGKIESLKEDNQLKVLLSENDKLLSVDFKKLTKKLMRSQIINDGKRVDGRDLDEVRKISASAGILPKRVHGSALFQRGLTQVLSTTTLGTPSDAQEMDDLNPSTEKTYLHHYNFPPYSVGETRPMRTPGRREIGHGALAERAIIPVLPGKETFPYVLRVVSEVLSSNGSTSMGSVCGSTLSLLDAGVPLKALVSGTAMGLIKEGKEVRILTDIQGIEDFLGDMDFKVAGTDKGITALQMDMKITGLPVSIISDAIKKARPARLHILEKMQAAIDKPQESLSPHAPRLLSFRIDPELIGTVIGPGGRTIKGITERTNTKIDIEDGGIVTIASHDGAAAEEAQKIIEGLTRKVHEGEIFSGVVTRIIPIGAFVEILPGKEGMVHISQLSEARVERVEDVVRQGDEVTVRVREIDSRGRINLTLRGVGQNNGMSYPEPTPTPVAPLN